MHAIIYSLVVFVVSLSLGFAGGLVYSKQNLKCPVQEIVKVETPQVLPMNQNQVVQENIVPQISPQQETPLVNSQENTTPQATNPSNIQQSELQENQIPSIEIPSTDNSDKNSLKK